MATQLEELPTVSIRRFREAVEKIEDFHTRVKVQTGYLLAARLSEISQKVTAWDFLRNASKPYGLFMKCKLGDFVMTPSENPALKETITQKALVITMAVAKRGKRITKKKRDTLKEDDKVTGINPQEIETTLLRYGQGEVLEKWKKGEVQIDPLLIEALQGRIHYKAVALPCTTVCEPWTLDLLRYLKEVEMDHLSFNLTRERLRQIYRENLKDILPPPHKRMLKNILRHYRISHLVEYYGFNAAQVTNYVGWTFKYAFGQLGVQGSSNIDYYLHLSWKSYFYNLLKPISMMT